MCIAQGESAAMQMLYQGTPADNVVDTEQSVAAVTAGSLVGGYLPDELHQAQKEGSCIVKFWWLRKR